MAKKASPDVGFFLIGGRSVLGAPMTEITESRERMLEQTDGLADSDDIWDALGCWSRSQRGAAHNGGRRKPCSIRICRFWRLSGHIEEVLYGLIHGLGQSVN